MFHLLPEKQLILALQQRDLCAFEFLYDTYSGTLNNIIGHFVHDKLDNAKVLEDVFHRIHNTIHSYDPEKGKLFTWMYIVTRETCIEQLSRIKVNKPPENSTLIGELDPVEVRKHLYHLDHLERQLIELVFFLGFSYSQVSSLLKIPIGTIKGKMIKAVNKLSKVNVEV